MAAKKDSDLRVDVNEVVLLPWVSLHVKEVVEIQEARAFHARRASTSVTCERRIGEGVLREHTLTESVPPRTPFVRQILVFSGPERPLCYRVDRGVESPIAVKTTRRASRGSSERGRGVYINHDLEP